MMKLDFDEFSPIEEGRVIVYAKGVYRQVRLYERAGKLYARHGSGFVRLSRGGGTSHTDVKWRQIDAGDVGYHEGAQFAVMAGPAPLKAAS